MGFQNGSGSPSATCGFLGDDRVQKVPVLQVDVHSAVQPAHLDLVKYRLLLGEFYAVFQYDVAVAQLNDAYELEPFISQKPLFEDRKIARSWYRITAQKQEICYY